MNNRGLVIALGITALGTGYLLGKAALPLAIGAKLACMGAAAGAVSVLVLKSAAPRRQIAKD